MRKIILFSLVFLAVSVMAGVSAFAAEVGLAINGSEKPFEPAPVLEDGRIMVPLRATFEALGAELHWDAERKTATGILNDLEVIIPVEDNGSVDKESPAYLDTSVKVLDGSVFVPLRCAFESLGSTVEWKPENKTAAIFTEIDLTEEELELLLKAVTEVPQSLTIVTEASQETGDNYELDFYQQGTASWYGSKFHGRATASGEIFNKNEFTAAHKSLPFGTKVKVTFLRTGRSVMVRINDYGPHVGGRIIDLSKAAAEEIGLRPHGLGTVKLELVNE